MNVKLIFVFTICVVLPNALHSDGSDDYAPDIDKRELYRKNLLEEWAPRKNGTFEVDDEENIFIRIFVQPGAKRSDLFIIPKMQRLGVNLTTPLAIELKADLQVLTYVSDLFRVPVHAIKIKEGWAEENKTVKLKPGYRAIEYVLNEIVDIFVVKKYGKTPNYYKCYLHENM